MESTSRRRHTGSDVVGADVQDVNGNTTFSPGQESNDIHETPGINSSQCESHLSASEEKSEQPLALAPFTVTARDLHSCIIASESTRSICSALIALLVILSHINSPVLGVNIVSSKSILAAKPLYMVLLSDITVVVAHIILSKRGGRRVITEEEVERKVIQEGLNWDRAVMVLERGLVLHQTIRALFIDCSVYVVIVACGLSLVNPT